MLIWLGKQARSSRRMVLEDVGIIGTDLNPVRFGSHLRLEDLLIAEGDTDGQSIG